MDTLTRLKTLSSNMQFEPAEDHGCPRLDKSKNYSGFVHNAVMPNGKSIALLKTLLTSACERDCNYCPFRAGRNFRRATLKPEEMAKTFMAMHKAGIVEGLFLSSGIIGGGVRTQDKILETAEILREKLYFHGYLHLKIMPGADRDQVIRIMQLADRVSLNLEAPNSKRLQVLAPHKVFIEELLTRLQWVDEIRRTISAIGSWKNRWPSLATQFVVGGAGETDHEILSTSDYLYRVLSLMRAYFSPFQPVEDTPLNDQAPTAYQRESRLYQASFLLRDYGFLLEDLPFNSHGNLPSDTEPKLAWARANLSHNPIEINTADRRDLLHIPGIGPKGAHEILKVRRLGSIEELEDLKKIGINPTRAVPFILLNGKRPAQQLALL